MAIQLRSTQLARRCNTPAVLGWRAAFPALVIGSLMLPGIAFAQSESTDGNVWTRATLLGDMGGLRTVLGNYGITLGVQDTETLLGNLSGGVKQGATMQGLTSVALQMDTGKAFGLANGTIDVSALQIHGRSLSPYYLDDLQTASGTEAANATRLWELWYDQAFDNGAFDVKLGQQSIDQEFIVSKYASLFVNAMAGWPMLPSADLYGGGPAYPLAALAARVQVHPAANLTLLGGVFDDNAPGGAFTDDPQSEDTGGLRFNLNTGALFIAEAQLTGEPFAGLAGTYKLGLWYDTGSFPTPAIDNQGIALVHAGSTYVPNEHEGNYSLYGVVDQTLWQPAGSARHVNGFARIMMAPADRNLITFNANVGLTLTDPLPGRSNDTAGIDLGLAQVNGLAPAADFGIASAPDSFIKVNGMETLVELTYQAQVTPWLQLQPVMEFVLNPGGGITNPDAPPEHLSNEMVVGLRSNITF
jgi:porin